MEFERLLRSHLAGLELGRSRPPKTTHRRVNADALRQHLIERLRIAEQIGADRTWIEQIHTDWAPAIPSLARYIERLSPERAPVGDAEAERFARDLIDEILGFATSIPLVDTLELSRTIEDFQAQSGFAETYCAENRLTHIVGATPRIAIGAAGRTFLRLRGRDAVRWLLTAEVIQSRGSADPWRVSVSLLSRIRGAGGIAPASDRGETSWQSLYRLESLGVLVAEPSNERSEISFTLVPDMFEVVDAVVSPGPWHAALSAMISDETSAAVFDRVPGAAEAQVEQSRMIAHEVRNALVPVRRHVDVLISGTDASPRDRMEAVRRGVVRVLEFVDQMVATADLVTETATAIDLRVVVEEAVAQIDEGERVVVVAPPELRAHAPRSRLAVVVANVLRNAVQSTSPEQPVRVSISRVDRAVRIEIDDGGAGVPEADRERIFHDGFTTRSGGSGLGLAIVKRTVEGALRGRVWCEASDLGGARFVITFPSETTP